MIWIALAVYVIGCAVTFTLVSMERGPERAEPPFEWRVRVGLALFWPAVVIVAIVVFFRTTAP